MRDSLYQDSPWANALFAGLCNQGAGQSGAIQDGVKDKKTENGKRTPARGRERVTEGNRTYRSWSYVYLLTESFCFGFLFFCRSLPPVSRESRASTR
jgi:hypothetical protein